LLNKTVTISRSDGSIQGLLEINVDASSVRVRVGGIDDVTITSLAQCFKDVVEESSDVVAIKRSWNWGGNSSVVDT
jgi:hypothetical protein